MTTMNDVIEINIDPPDPDVIDYLENLLRQAKTGEIQSIATAVSFSGKRSGNGWAGMNKCNMTMLGEVEVLKRDLMDTLISLRIDPITGEESD